MNKALVFFIGCLLLIAIEILRVYFIMPFPGSQQSDTIDIAYFIHNNIEWMRLLLLAIIGLPFYQIITKSKWWLKVLAIIPVLFFGLVFYLFNYKFLADKMFYKPEHKIFADYGHSKTPLDALIIGVEINGEAKSFPIELIGYHHQVEETIGGERVLITYCTVCRSGRVYSPVVNGKPAEFRLVGMDHFNAMFEDATTKSWWRQVSGVAIEGKLKGDTLKEIPSQQMTLVSWLNIHPNSLIMQPDPKFLKRYEGLKGFDKGTIKGSLEARDTLSWKNKSWIVGTVNNGLERAYDWNDLQKLKVINDTLNDDAVVLILQSDRVSFGMFYAKVDSIKESLTFFITNLNQHDFIISDKQTNSVWNDYGVCTVGALKGNRLQHLQSYQEFWHSWKIFHPNTTSYKQ
ncbi:MAG: DUF3179 domain-containing (seleno)protein [Bacteroidia bacterium]